MSEAVLDAGPLIYLAELVALDTLMDFSVLFIPMAVQEEGGCHRIKALDFRLMKSDPPFLPSTLSPLGHSLTHAPASSCVAWRAARQKSQSPFSGNEVKIKHRSLYFPSAFSIAARLSIS